MTAPVELSVVVASIDAARTIDECLRRFDRTCTGRNTEVIVVDASADDSADRVTAHTGATLLRMAVGTLTPVLWAEGFRRTSGRVVAFTTGHCLPEEGWADAMLAAIADGASGAGGPLVIAPGTRPLDWAVFYLRYSAFMPGTLGTGPIDGEIAGDNAAYAREVLDRHAATFAHGFWEVDFHRLVRMAGGWLMASPKAVVHFGPSFPAATIIRHRFAHGRQFGAGRARGGRPKWILVAGAPAVPLVLAWRTALRVWRGGEPPLRFVASLPWFLILAAAWAAGEAWGAVRG